MKKHAKAVLIEAAQEMINVMGLEDEGQPIVVNPKDTYENILSLIQEAIPVIQPGDEFSKKTTDVIASMTEEDVAEPAAEADTNVNLSELVDHTKKLVDLQKILTDYPEFLPIKDRLSSVRNTFSLKKQMKDFLITENSAPTPTDVTAATAAAANTLTPTDAPKVIAAAAAAAKSKISRVDAVCEALKQNPTSMEDWISKSNAIMTANGGVANDQENKFIIRYAVKILKNFGVATPEK